MALPNPRAVSLFHAIFATLIFRPSITYFLLSALSNMENIFKTAYELVRTLLSFHDYRCSFFRFPYRSGIPSDICIGVPDSYIRLNLVFPLGVSPTNHIWNGHPLLYPRLSYGQQFPTTATATVFGPYYRCDY